MSDIIKFPSPEAAIAETLHRGELLKAAMQKVLVFNQDFGPAFPGDTKNTLLKPGAEKLCSIFHIVPTITCQYTDLHNGHLRVVATCEVATRAGEPLARTEAVASTMEAKYRFKGSKGRPCPKCKATACYPSKKEYGGGFYCKDTDGGCGEKFKSGSEEAKALEMLQPVRNENDSPADLWNTISKMAQKRALMSAILLATGASALFTTDEGDPDHFGNANKKADHVPDVRKTNTKPQSKPQPPGATDERFISLEQLDVIHRKGYEKYGDGWPEQCQVIIRKLTRNAESNVENCAKEMYPHIIVELEK